MFIFEEIIRKKLLKQDIADKGFLFTDQFHPLGYHQ